MLPAIIDEKFAQLPVGTIGRRQALTPLPSHPVGCRNIFCTAVNHAFEESAISTKIAYHYLFSSKRARIIKDSLQIYDSGKTSVIES